MAHQLAVRCPRCAALWSEHGAVCDAEDMRLSNHYRQAEVNERERLIHEVYEKARGSFGPNRWYGTDGPWG